MSFDLGRRVAAECVGAALLTAAVIGSGIMGARLAGGDDALALLGNTLATAAILYVLVTALGPISGAHLNPAVTAALALRRAIGLREAALYVMAQTVGCVAGAMLAHAAFELPMLQIATTERTGAAQTLSEGAATFTLVAAIQLTSRFRPAALAAVVALTIAAGYWWTSSTSFANPAITIARTLSDTFAGVRPQDAPGFMLAQFAGAGVATLACGWLYRTRADHAVSTAAATRSVSSSGG